MHLKVTEEVSLDRPLTDGQDSATLSSTDFSMFVKRTITLQNTKKLCALSRDLAFSVCALQVGVTEVHCQMRDGDMILKEKAVSGEERTLLCSTSFHSWLSNHTRVFDGHFGVVWKFAVLGTCPFFQVYVFMVQP